MSSCYSRDSSDSEAPTPKRGAGEQSIVEEICRDLAQKGEILNKEIEDMRSLEGSCMKALERLQLEQAAWAEKLRGIKARMSQIEKKKDEAALMLDLHQVLRASGGLAEAVRAAQQVISAEQDAQIEDELFAPLDAEAGKCLICTEDISAEELFSKLKEDYKGQPHSKLTICKKCAAAGAKESHQPSA